MRFTPEPNPAFIDMLSRDEANGYDPPPPQSPQKVEPLIPFTPPPPDWRAEEEERARRKQREPKVVDAAEVEPTP